MLIIARKIAPRTVTVGSKGEVVMASTRVAGDLYFDIHGQLLEIIRQLRQKEGYPYDSMKLVDHLQAAIEGKLVNRHGQPFASGGATVVKQADLLRRITTVTVPGAQYFVGKGWLKAANVGWTGENFNRLFLDKAEENVPEVKLAVNRLERASLDAPILTELGEAAEIQLVYLFDLLKKQSKGEGGVLLTNGYVNIFYVRDANGNLWVVNARWRSGYRYWHVEARSVELPFRWRGGYQVFSRDS
jgi:hypothetical protein